MSDKTITLLLNVWTAIGASALTASTFILHKHPVSSLFVAGSFSICFAYYHSNAGSEIAPAFAGLLGLIITPFQKLYQRLRKIPFLKVFIISLCWTVLTAMLPLLSINETNWIFLLSRFLFIAAISLAFDVVDIEYDRGVIKTLPVAIGPGFTSVVSVLLLMASTIIANHSLDIGRLASPTGLLLIAFFYLTPGRTWWKNLLLDGVMILYFALSFIP